MQLERREKRIFYLYHQSRASLQAYHFNHILGKRGNFVYQKIWRSMHLLILCAPYEPDQIQSISMMRRIFRLQSKTSIDFFHVQLIYTFVIFCHQRLILFLCNIFQMSWGYVIEPSYIQSAVNRNFWSNFYLKGKELPYMYRL